METLTLLSNPNLQSFTPNPQSDRSVLLCPSAGGDPKSLTLLSNPLSEVQTRLLRNFVRQVIFAAHLEGDNASSSFGWHFTVHCLTRARQSPGIGAAS